MKIYLALKLHNKDETTLGVFADPDDARLCCTNNRSHLSSFDIEDTKYYVLGFKAQARTGETLKALYTRLIDSDELTVEKVICFKEI